MEDWERGQLARMCRRQAGLASTHEVRATLIELAEHYETEAEEPAASPLPEFVEPPPQKVE
jgi:hypothetical protein